MADKDYQRSAVTTRVRHRAESAMRLEPVAFRTYALATMVERLVSDPLRDATDAIRGYMYQAYQSVLAWVQLREDEWLFLEGAEDFDVCSPSDAMAVQVKDRPSRPVTLRSPDVVAAINNFWDHKQRNPGRPIRLRFLTTAEPGMETRAPFTGCGLDYWKRVVDRTAPAAPLLGFLKTLQLREALLLFLRNASEDDLHTQFLSRIEWDTGSRPLETLKIQLLDALVLFGAERRVSPHESQRALDSLLARVVETLASKGTKQLTLADFYRAFEAATMEVMTKREAEVLRANGARHTLQASTTPTDAQPKQVEPASKFWTCPACENRIKDGLLVCIHCKAIVIYGSTERESRRDKTLGSQIALVASTPFVYLLLGPLERFFGLANPLGRLQLLGYLSGFFVLLSFGVGHRVARSLDRRRKSRPPRFFAPTV